MRRYNYILLTSSHAELSVEPTEAVEIFHDRRCWCFEAKRSTPDGRQEHNQQAPSGIFRGCWDLDRKDIEPSSTSPWLSTCGVHKRCVYYSQNAFVKPSQCETTMTDGRWQPFPAQHAVSFSNIAILHGTIRVQDTPTASSNVDMHPAATWSPKNC